MPKKYIECYVRCLFQKLCKRKLSLANSFYDMTANYVVEHSVYNNGMVINSLFIFSRRI